MSSIVSRTSHWTCQSIFHPLEANTDYDSAIASRILSGMRALSYPTAHLGGALRILSCTLRAIGAILELALSAAFVTLNDSCWKPFWNIYLLKKNNTQVSRRRFVTLGVLGTGGLWTAWTDLCATRLLPRIVAETRRPVARPTFRPEPGQWNDNALTAAWLGHSTVLLNFYGLTILADPVLFRRVGANIRIGTVGPKRLIEPALNVRELPPIDLVLLSHAHMDHLDLPTLRCLPALASTPVITARATADILRRTKVKKVSELGWGDHETVSTPKGDVRIDAFEVKHWGARWKRDKHRGYNGYVLSREGKKIIFGGDTAMSDSFKSLHSRGPYELAIMPIGAYQPWVCSHCTPEQSLRMANDAGAKYFLPIHHKTFCLGQEGPIEPLERLEAAVESDRLALRHVGETFSVA